MRTNVMVLTGLSMAATASGQAQAAQPQLAQGASRGAASPHVRMVSGDQASTHRLVMDSDWGTRSQRLETKDDKARWIVGAEANVKPDYFGRSGRGYGLRPVLAVEWGRFHASTGGGRGLMGQGRDRNSARSGSIEGTVRATDRFNMSVGFSVDRGRSGARSDRLDLAPKVPATARMKVKARYFLGQRWTASVGASQDILGKHGGLKGDVRLAYEHPFSQATTITWAAEASFGNGAYMRSQYGIPNSPKYGFAPFRPSAGLYESNVGVDVAHAISRHWVAFGGIGYSHLHGDAKRSPMTLHNNGASAAIGIAWRN